MASAIEDLEWGLKHVRLGNIRASLDHTMVLKDAADAHRKIANNEIQGNVVLLPWAAQPCCLPVMIQNTHWL